MKLTQTSSLTTHDRGQAYDNSLVKDNENKNLNMENTSGAIFLVFFCSHFENDAIGKW